MMFLIAPTVGLGLLSTLFAPTLPIQPSSLAQPTAVVQQAGTPDPLEQVVEYYQPKKAPLRSLRNAAANFLHKSNVRHELRIDENTTVMQRASFEVYGNSLMVLDSRQKIGETLELLRGLDENYTELASEDEAKLEQTQLFQYSVTHVSVDSVRKAFTSLYAELQPEGDYVFTGPKLSYVDERNLVLMRGTADQIAEAKTILEQLDVPKPRVLLSFYLIEGASADENDARVPAELVKDLSELVPYEGFKLLASAMLSGDTTGGMELRTELEWGRGGLYLQLLPVAYDKASETLALGRAEVRLSDGLTGAIRSSLVTSTSLKAGTYTVLGAVGTDPIFVVIKMTTMR